MNSKKAIIATAVIFLIIVVTFAACKRGIEPIVVTDPNGNPVTDVNGEVITVIPETEIIEYTDENGEVKTTIRYIPQDVAIPVTDANGEAVTNENGEVLTTIVVVPVESTTGIIINVPVTNENGETQTNSNGDIITETTVSSLPEDAPSNNIAISAAVGGSGSDSIVAADATPDGGYIVAFNTNSRDGGMSSTAGYNGTASVIKKYSKTGLEEWTKAVGGAGNTAINDIFVDKNGNIFVAGNAKRNDFFTNHSSEYDAFIQKYSSTGELVFTKGWGGKSNESFYSVATDSTGAIYAVGFAYSQDGDCASLKIPASDSQAVIVKYDANGTVVSQKGFGSFGDYFSDIDINGNDELFLSGIFSSKTDKSVFKNMGYADAAIFKLKTDLSTVFSREWGGSRVDFISQLAVTNDGGCIAVGNSKSSDNFLFSIGNKGGNDAIIVKWNGNGEIAWAKSFAGTENDCFTGVDISTDGTITAVGHSSSNTRDFKFVGNLGGTDAFVAKYTPGGSLLSAQCFGGSGDDEFSAVCILTNGQTLAAGSSLSVDGYLANLNPKSDGDKKVGMIFSFR